MEFETLKYMAAVAFETARSGYDKKITCGKSMLFMLYLDKHQDELKAWSKVAKKAIAYYLKSEQDGVFYNKVKKILSRQMLDYNDIKYVAFIPSYYEQGLMMDADRLMANKIVNDFKKQAAKNPLTYGEVGKRYKTAVKVEKVSGMFFGTAYLFSTVKGKKFVWISKGKTEFQQGENINLAFTIKSRDKYTLVTRCKAA